MTPHAAMSVENLNLESLEIYTPFNKREPLLKMNLDLEQKDTNESLLESRALKIDHISENETSKQNVSETKQNTSENKEMSLTHT